MPRTTRQWAYMFSVLSIIGPFLLLIANINLHYVDIIHSDELEYIPLMERLWKGTFTRSDLFVQHLSHRVTVPFLLVAAVATVSDWHVPYELLYGPVLAAVSVFILMAIVDRTHFVLPFWQRQLLALCISLFAFSLVQHTVWVKSPFFIIHALNTFFLAALWLLFRRVSKWTVAGAALLSIIASFSLHQGLLVWVALLPLLLQPEVLRSWRRRIIPLVWMGLMSVTVWFYYRDYQAVSYGKQQLVSFIQYIDYFMVFLGAALLPGYEPAARVAGVGLMAIVLILCIATLRSRPSYRSALPWLCLTLYVLLMAAAAAIGRSGFGTAQALQPRYTAMSYLIVVAVLGWATLAVPQRQVRQVFVLGLLGVISVSQFLFSFYSLSDWHDYEAQLRRGRKCFYDYKVAEHACLELLGNGLMSGDDVRELAARYLALTGRH